MWKWSRVNRCVSRFERNSLIQDHPGWHIVIIGMSSRSALVRITQQHILSTGRFGFAGSTRLKQAGEQQCLLLAQRGCLTGMTKSNPFSSEGSKLTVCWTGRESANNWRSWYRVSSKLVKQQPDEP